MATKITQELAAIKRNYDTNINILDGLYFKQKDVIRMVEFYSSSRYLKGQKDELGREKPFYNIVNAMCDVENAAKDIDTKDITATSDDGEHYVESFLISKDIYEWMKTVNFAKTLNDMRDTHTRYGSLLVKKCTEIDKNGDKVLKIDMPEWKNVITDQIDIIGQPIIEMHYMSPLEMNKMEEWDKIKVREVIKKLSKKGTGKRIPVYEIRGEFPKSFMKEMKDEKYSDEDKDEYTYSYQLYYIAGDYSEIGNSNQSITNSLFTNKLTVLYHEDNTEKVYKYLARKKKSGRAFGVGVVEEGEQAQIGTNDAIIKQSRAMEYTSKVIGQTASKKLKGRNMLTEVDDGQILEHEDKKPIEALNLLPSGGLQQYGNLISQWFAQYEKTTSAYPGQRGAPQSGNVPFRAQAQQLQQSGTVFEDLQEELGIFITEIFEDWIMPFLSKSLNSKHILAHEFSMDELKEIDKNFSTNHANEIVSKLILSGKVATEEDYSTALQTAQEAIQQTKSSRFLEVPEDLYKNANMHITVNVTGEQRNKATVLESLLNIMQVYASNPNIAQDPVLMQIFMKIVELSGAGISPVSLVAAIQEHAKMMQEQQMAAEQAQQIGQQPQAAQAPTDKLSLAANPTPA